MLARDRAQISGSSGHTQPARPEPGSWGGATKGRERPGSNTAATKGAPGPHGRGGSTLSGAGRGAEPGGSSESHTRRDDVPRCAPQRLRHRPHSRSVLHSHQKWEQPECPLTSKWINAWWHMPSWETPTLKQEGSSATAWGHADGAERRAVSRTREDGRVPVTRWSLDLEGARSQSPSPEHSLPAAGRPATLTHTHLWQQHRTALDHGLSIPGLGEHAPPTSHSLC